MTMRFSVLPFVRQALCMIALAFSCAQTALGQVYPNRPVRLVLPAPPGTLTDLIAGAIQTTLEQKLGQRIVVEHRPGAAGIIGSQAVATAAPDGYTLLLAATNFLAINQFIYPRLPYDPLRDFAPVSVIVDVPMMIYSSNALPAKTLRELIAHALANPGKLNYGSAGTGTTPHLSMEIFAQAAGLRLVHVPFKGGTPGVNALVANEVQLMMTGLATATGQIRGGLVRPIAVAARERLAALPDMPTFAEAGYAELQAAIPSTWWGLVAPKATDAAIVRRWAAEIRAALADPASQKRYQGFGLTPVGSTPEEFAALLAADSQKWEKIVRQLDIKPE